MIKSNIERVVFHGTSNNVFVFSEDSVGLGSDPNSSLGVHTTDSVDSAMEYASRSMVLDEAANIPIVLVLSYQSAGQEFMLDADDFYGTHDDDTNNKAHFEQLRREYIEDGVDLIEFEGGEEPITTLLMPDKISLVDTLTLTQASALSKCIDVFGIRYDDTKALLAAVEHIKGCVV